MDLSLKEGTTILKSAFTSTKAESTDILSSKPSHQTVDQAPAHCELTIVKYKESDYYIPEKLLVINNPDLEKLLQKLSSEEIEGLFRSCLASYMNTSFALKQQKNVENYNAEIQRIEIPSTVGDNVNKGLLPIALLLIPFISILGKQNLILAQQDGALADGTSIILASGAKVGRANTDKLMKQYNKIKKQLEKARKRAGLFGLALGGLELITAVVGIAKGMATANPTSFSSGVALFCDGAFRATCSTLILTTGSNNKALMNGVQYGVFSVFGDYAKQAQAVGLCLLMTFSASSQIAALANTCIEATFGAMAVTGAVLAQTSLVFILAASTTVAVYFSFANMIKSFEKNQEQENPLSPEQIAAMGGIEAVVCFIMEKYGIREKLVEQLDAALANQFGDSAKKSGKVVEEFIETIVYMAMAFGCHQAASYLDQSLMANCETSLSEKMNNTISAELKDAFNNFMQSVKSNQKVGLLNDYLAEVPLKLFMHNMIASQLASTGISVSSAFTTYHYNQIMNDQQTANTLNEIYQDQINSSIDSLNNLTNATTDKIMNNQHYIENLANNIKQAIAIDGQMINNSIRC